MEICTKYVMPSRVSENVQDAARIPGGEKPGQATPGLRGKDETCQVKKAEGEPSGRVAACAKALGQGAWCTGLWAGQRDRGNAG